VFDITGKPIDGSYDLADHKSRTRRSFLSDGIRNAGSELFVLAATSRLVVHTRPWGRAA
jgi:hypothetical protein